MSLTEHFVDAWLRAVRATFADDWRRLWTKDVKRDLATQVNLAACLDVCDKVIRERIALTFAKRGPTIEAQASDLCRKKTWRRQTSEFLRLDFSALVRSKPSFCDIAAEIENNSISLERNPEPEAFLHSDTFGLADFIKLLAAPARTRIYVGRTMRHGKKTVAQAKQVQTWFSDLVADSIAAGRLLPDDHIIVLLIYMQEQGKSWPEGREFKFGVAERSADAASLTWDERVFQRPQ